MDEILQVQCDTFIWHHQRSLSSVEWDYLINEQKDRWNRLKKKVAEKLSL